MSEEDKLKELAATDWQEFVRIIGPDAVLVAKIRLLRLNGKSYQQISTKLHVTENQARYASKDIKTKLLKSNAQNQQG